MTGTVEKDGHLCDLKCLITFKSYIGKMQRTCKVFTEEHINYVWNAIGSERTKFGTNLGYLFVVPNYGGYTYLGGRDFPLHGIRSKKGIGKKYLLGMMPKCIGITMVCYMRYNT
mmetsp:Transcript_16485/g.29794  ORF Transcript_16485/g.29794 Transcript_16485/m.29794 type:complete len:114 (+) Transcript_16485:1848-2189(+)